MISKNGTQITTLDEWFTLAGPMSDDQWVVGRSAQELARDWLTGLPEPVSKLIASHRCFGDITKWHAEPEVKLPFDDFQGNPRISDLVVYAEDLHGPFIVTVEGKCHESFGDMLPRECIKALEAVVENPRSNKLNRIDQLAKALFSAAGKGQPSLAEMRYQLMTATAGAIAEAHRRGVLRVVLLVQVYETDVTDAKLLKQNSLDLNNFVHRLTGGTILSIADGQMIGPIILPSNADLKDAVRLFIGKTTKVVS